MNKERDMKPMTKEEEYRNADVPMPEDEFKKAKEAADLRVSLQKALDGAKAHK